jgi:hypothetical protein
MSRVFVTICLLFVAPAIDAAAQNKVVVGVNIRVAAG